MPTSTTDTPLTVSTDGTAGPYVIVTPEQFRPVTDALRAEGIRFRVEENAVLLGGMPALAVIDLGIGADVEQIKRVLDRVAAQLQTIERRRRCLSTRRELVVRGDGEAMQELRRRLNMALSGEWSRRADVEERFRKTLPQRTSAYCFSKRVHATRHQAAVLMRGRSPGEGEELYISGVVPLEGREPFSLEQHDQIITDFRKNLLEPLGHGLSIRLLDYRVPIQPALEQILSSAALTRLGAFSTAARKSNFHSLDMRQWAGFIGQTHLDDAVIDLGLLASWLDDEGFPQDERDRLIDDFESGRRLLRVYDEERREQWPQ
jgi:hypothetical protein